MRYKIFGVLVHSLVIYSFFASLVYAWPARVVHVADGDTITVEPAEGGDRVKIRLHGIDAPESRQAYGQAAKGFVVEAVLFKPVDIEEKAIDKYGRTVAVVHVADTTLQEMLLASGYAWVWTRYCKNCKDWVAIERTAVKAKRGLWQDEEPVAPWIWRRANKKR